MQMIFQSLAYIAVVAIAKMYMLGLSMVTERFSRLPLSFNPLFLQLLRIVSVVLMKTSYLQVTQIVHVIGIMRR